jgi:hypothetical protein
VVTALGEAVHLFPAGELLPQGYPRTPVAVCGKLVTGEPDGEDDPPYCPECVRTVLRWCAEPVMSVADGPARWAISPTDGKTHALVPVGAPLPGILQARCGHRLPVGTVAHHRPPGWAWCVPCLVASPAYPGRDYSGLLRITFARAAGVLRGVCGRGNQPVSGTMKPVYDHCRDVNDIHTSVGARVEQIAVAKGYGALAMRLHRRGVVLRYGHHTRLAGSGGGCRIWVTSVTDRLDHAVTPEAMEAARMTGGRPVAACGTSLLSAALCAPPQPRCPNCRDLAVPTPRQTDRRRRGRHARPALWRRLRDRTCHG